MKHLKSSLEDMRLLFGRTVTARHIAEPLVSFDAPSSASTTRAFMERRDFDVVGVRFEGSVRGFALRQELQGGELGNWVRQFDEATEIVQEHDTLTTVLQRLAATPIVYVRMMGEVSGIITKGDLQKAPVRLWLFGLLSLLEMHFLRLIRASFGDGSWTSSLSAERLSKAQGLLRERQRRNEAIDLADCLQFADKAKIVSAAERLRLALGFESRHAFDHLTEELKRLRDQLAHSNDIIGDNWPRLPSLASDLEALVEACEGIT